MEFLNRVIDGLLQWLLRPFAWAPPLVDLALISVVTGVGMLWILAKTSDPARIRAVRRRALAHLLEMRLFQEEPAVMWRAQGSLLRANLRYLGLMLRPAIVMAVPLVLLMSHLNAFYGQAPLVIGQDAIVTLALSQLDPRAPVPVLAGPRGILIDDPPVRAVRQSQISWRIRPIEAVSGDLRLTVNGATITKQVEAGSGRRFVSARRVSSIVQSLWRPSEPRLHTPGIDWLDIGYPGASVGLFSIRMHWIAWFTILSMLTVLLLKRRFGVSI